MADESIFTISAEKATILGRLDRDDLFGVRLMLNEAVEQATLEAYKSALSVVPIRSEQLRNEGLEIVPQGDLKAQVRIATGQHKGTLSFSNLAQSLEQGQLTVRALRQLGGVAKNLKKPRSSGWKRSRTSLSVGGYPSKAKGTPTAGWIEDAQTAFVSRLSGSAFKFSKSQVNIIFDAE